MFYHHNSILSILLWGQEKENIRLRDNMKERSEGKENKEKDVEKMLKRKWKVFD